MVEPNVELHRQRLAHRSHAEPLRGGDRGMAEFPTIRAIQAHLIEQAEANGVTVVDPSGQGCNSPTAARKNPAEKSTGRRERSTGGT